MDGREIISGDGTVMISKGAGVAHVWRDALENLKGRDARFIFFFQDR
jgi:hypothetical protein